jgi:hypothetical protein
MQPTSLIHLHHRHHQWQWQHLPWQQYLQHLAVRLKRLRLHHPWAQGLVVKKLHFNQTTRNDNELPGSNAFG